MKNMWDGGRFLATEKQCAIFTFAYRLLCWMFRLQNEVSEMKPKADRSGLMALRQSLTGVF